MNSHISTEKKQDLTLITIKDEPSIAPYIMDRKSVLYKYIQFERNDKLLRSKNDSDLNLVYCMSKYSAYIFNKESRD